eukprot:12059575-Alexandrium_andersonii.AAC.1
MSCMGSATADRMASKAGQSYHKWDGQSWAAPQCMQQSSERKPAAYRSSPVHIEPERTSRSMVLGTPLSLGRSAEK